MNYLIILENVFKTYQMGEVELPVLRGISLRIAMGEFIAIMGPSGSGKSTLMNIIGCLDTLSDGAYFLEDEDVSRFDRDRLAEIRNQKIGFVFQFFNLLNRTNAVENVELPMMYGGISRKVRRARALQLLQSVGLSGREHHYPSQLSGGEQQRVAIARALSNNPAIILADEPTGNLDSKSATEIMEIFRKLNNDGVTIVLVTHETDIARYAKRRILLKDGTIQQDSTS
ncbi:MAG TPA: ABC transporter ATP-binding protein [Candidatus Brocadiales bacterium]|nr:ABC transporter ATP-binding protein [Candidatus Brocadiales bacterium]